MSADIVWAGWLGLFLVYEVAAALRERGTDQRLTLSRQVWAWFDKAFERVVLGVFLLVLTAHLVFGRPGGLAVILTAAPVVLVILVALVRRPAALVVLVLPLLLGADRCSIQIPGPGPSPTAPPTTEPTAEPTLPPPTTTLPPPPPTTLPPPPTAGACPRPLGPGAEIYMNNRAYGQGLDSTVRVRGDLAFCQAIHGPAAGADCHLDGMPAPWTTVGCELELLGKTIGKAQACPVWRYRSSGWEGPCVDNQAAQMSCDHFGSAGGRRDDPKTPAFEGEPEVCGEQRDAYGPIAGFFTVAHGKGEVRACLPSNTGCGPWVAVDH